MVELKTLKDINWSCECENEDCTSKIIVKELGIKWIKELSNADKAEVFKIKIEEKEVSQEAIDFGIGLLRTIFNINEKDLTEKTTLKEELKKRNQLTPKIEAQLNDIEKKDLL